MIEIVHAGPPRAGAIVEGRPWSSVEALIAVHGIGQGRLRDILDQGTACVGVVADHGCDLPSAITCFMGDFEACIAHLRLPVTHRRAIRTTNLLERLFLEERRRLKIIPDAFGERPVLKLMFGAMTRAADRWRAMRFNGFEQRQINAVRHDLDQE